MPRNRSNEKNQPQSSLRLRWKFMIFKKSTKKIKVNKNKTIKTSIK